MLTGPLFPLLVNCKKKFIVLQGGGDAGKTVTALQYLAVTATQEAGLVITVVGQDIPNLKVGALRSFQRYVASDPEIKPFILSYNETHRRYLFTNGTIIEFTSFGDEQDAKGSERDILFVNEANAIPYAIFWQLKRKTRRKIIIDYNPNAPFWAHSEILSGTNREYKKQAVQYYQVDHRHNPFLSDEEHEAYESISDPEMFKVYARGETGLIKGLIFGHIRKCGIEAVPVGLYHPVDNPDGYDRVIWATDYGYTNDPTAVVKITIKGRKYWIKEILYDPPLVDGYGNIISPTATSAPRKEVTGADIKEALLANGYTPEEPVYSEADPNMINQLRMLGVTCLPAIKGPGSKNAGISKVREFECWHYESPNIGKEITLYKWVTAQDLTTGKEVMTNQPMDGYDHGLDATRYGIYTDSFRVAA